MLAVVFFLSASNAGAQNIMGYSPLMLAKSADLQAIVDRAANDTLMQFASKGFKSENLAITLIDLRNSDKLTFASFRGEEKIYPASVVKMFYLTALHQWLNDGKLKDSPELQRTRRDMIVDSSNDATQAIVDILTDTGGGGELSQKDLKKFAYKRNAVNRYFSALGFQNINVCQKTFCEDAYGREQQFRGKDGANRNKLTTDATARLLAEIVLGKAVNRERSWQMLDLMKRSWEGTAIDNEDQAHGFTGIALKNLNLAGAKLWSKAGWTSTTRHDAAYVELPNGLKFILVTFTTDFANERDIIPNVARIVIESLGGKP